MSVEILVGGRSGEGKTTVAILIATALREHGFAVKVVDAGDDAHESHAASCVDSLGLRSQESPVVVRTVHRMPASKGV